MSRTNKNFNTKKDELLQSIWDIFIENGYEDTTLQFIINSLNISKGGFYHYFSSKEECADSAIELKVQSWLELITKKDNKNLKADERLKNIILIGAKLTPINSTQNKNINLSSNKLFHQKLMVSIIKKFSPIYAEIISQGIDEKIFNTAYPLEASEMILTLSNFYLDADLFNWDSENILSKVNAFEDTVSRILGTEKDSFNFINDLFESEVR